MEPEIGTLWVHKARGHLCKVEYTLRVRRKRMVAYRAPAQGVSDTCSMATVSEFLNRFERLAA